MSCHATFIKSNEVGNLWSLNLMNEVDWKVIVDMKGQVQRVMVRRNNDSKDNDI